MSGWLGREVAKAPALYGALLVVAVAFLAYANSAGAGFHFDDSHAIVANPYIRDLAYVPDYLGRPDRFSALPGHRMYRPLTLLSYAWNYHTGGYDPLHWRLTAIALHAFSAVGIFLIIRHTPGALVAALLFAVHPVFTETVDYASARSSLLATALCVWSFLAWRSGRRGMLLVSVVLFAGALLSKEIAIVLPALLLWADRRRWKEAVPFGLVACLYLFARQMLLGTAVVDFAAREAARAVADAGSGGARPVLWNLYTQARVVGAYVLLFLAPFGLCVHRHVRVSETPLEAGVIGGALLIAGALWLAWRWRRERPWASLGLVWFLVALAPTSSFIPLNQVMNEHRLYLPGVGLALVAASFAPRLRTAAPVLVLLLALTVQRNRDWSDPVRLWQSAVDVSPRSDGAWNALGVQLRFRGDDAGAEAAFRRCLELQPQSWDAAFNLGTLHLQRGRDRDDPEALAQALHWLGRANRIRPGAQRSEWYRAETLYELGLEREAVEEFRRLGSLSPRLHEMTRYPLAKMALDGGRLAEAAAFYEEALGHGTDPVAARLGLARVAWKRGDRREAARQAQLAIEARPHSPDPHLFLAELHAGTPLAPRHLIEAERRGYRPSEEKRRSILEGDAS